MFLIPGYKVFNTLYQDAKNVLYHGERVEDDESVVIKANSTSYPASSFAITIRNEYEITKDLEIDGILRPYALEKYKDKLVLILEDMGGLPLKTHLSSKKMSLEVSLELAVSLADTIGEVHRKGIIHKEINPNNIFFNPRTNQVKLAGFGAALLLPREEPGILAHALVEGSFDYVSPEQTGRMSRVLDYRTDFYSLGVTFYEILGGKLPYRAKDSLEMVHAHMAREPMPLVRINPTIPEVLSEIVLKLLAKSAEERYQSASGLKKDLEHCLKQWRTKGSIDRFELGCHDYPGNLVIPQKLYGRESELDILDHALNLTSQGKGTLMMVSGYAGIGKTSLVREIQSAVAGKGGYFITGKFDQLKRNIPYSGMVQAFRELVLELLTQSEPRIKNWKEKLLQALGDNGQIIIDVIQELEYVIGFQPPVKELGPVETQNRFNLVFQNFIHVFCSKDHPLVIFLDDLQWVDTATLKLMEVISTYDENKYLMLIGAYRSNEVNSSHPLILWLENLKEASAPLKQIHLGLLKISDILRLTSDTLREDEETVEPLAKSVLKKTYGNPFFAKQFLSSLSALGLLVFNKKEERWLWNSDDIEVLNVTDNVVDLLITRMQRLTSETRNVMRLGACIGNRFELSMLAIIAGMETIETFQHLLPVLKEGLVITTSNHLFGGADPQSKDRPQSFRFIHDRVQQAAYTLIEEEERKPVHLKIGRLMLENQGENDLDDQVFDILNHFNFSCDLINQRKEREEIARLNLSAGLRAKAAAAFDQAFEYFKTGIEFLAQERWRDQYELTLKIHTEATEAACLSGQFETMEAIFETVIRHSRSTLDKTGVYETLILGRMLQSKPEESLEAALEILKELGVVFPDDFSLYDPRREMEKTWSTISKKTIDELLNIAQMTDPLQLATLRILVETGPSAYFSRVELLTPIVLKELELTLRYGNSYLSPYIFCLFGLILCGIVGNIEEGYQSAQIGLRFMEHLGAKDVKCMMYHIFNGLVRHYKEHIRKSTEMTEEVFQAGLETGDFQYAGWYVYMHCMHLFMAGDKLSNVRKEMVLYNEAIKKIHQQTALGMHEPGHQAVLNLMGDAKNPTLLIGDVYDERSRLPLIRKANDRNSILNYYFSKVMLCYLFEDYEGAAENADEGIQYLDGSTALLVVQLFHFYDSLAQIAVLGSRSGSERERAMERIPGNRKKMELWATHAPMNYLHKYHLIEAERLRVLGQDTETIVDHYDHAIQSANENGFCNEEAMANELAAKFQLEKGNHEIASRYMRNAFKGYYVWGAVRKCRDLEERYPGLLAERPSHHSFSPHKDTAVLDLGTMIKASQAISSEIELDRLLKNFMKIVIENVGAQKGFLIFRSQGRLMVEAGCTVDENAYLFRPAVSVREVGQIPSMIVDFVARTHKNVVIDDAGNEGKFESDPYIKSIRPKSVLCVPILHQSALAGVIYLENNLISGAFTQERLEVINVLAIQIAISVENARLYDGLKKAEQKYRGIFENAVEGIYQTSPEGHFVEANPAMARMFGFSSSAELLESITNIEHQLYVNPEKRNEFRDMIGNHQTVSGFEVQFYRKDGIKFWASLHSRPVYDEEGVLLYFEGIVTDITEKKKRFEALLESEEYLRKENIQLRSNVKDRFRFGAIVGKSRTMQEVYELILRASASDANVIIYGESGTGKELVARAIHDLSDRKDGSYVPVNSGAIPENLIESAFFGYRKGAFTGATIDKHGYLDLADGGSMFLDELGELDLHMQVKLLRAIDGGGYTPLGDTALKHSNVRIIAATNHDLEDHVRKGMMREDFFYRIHIIPIYLPPLRKRKEDIPLLVEHFMEMYGHGDKSRSVTGAMINSIMDYDWPGNVRELQNALQRYVTLGDLGFLGVRSTSNPDDAQYERMADKALRLKDATKSFEKNYINQLLEKTNWNRGKVARILGIDRRTLFRKIKTYEIEMSQ
jgi:PAS domain S-box-containing protein